MLRTNLGCFWVVFFDVLICSPFVTNTVEHGSFHRACCEGYLSITQGACHGIYSSLMKKKTGRMSPSGLNRRVNAHDSLGYGRGYWSGLLMIMVVKFTHQLGKKFPREDLHPAGSVTFEVDLDNVKAYDSGLRTGSTKASDYVPSASGKCKMSI